jgi:hypothetical protein
MGCFRDFLGGSIQAFSFSFCFLQARYVLSLHIRIPFIAHPWLNTLLPCGIGIDTKALLDIATILAFRVLENCAINPSFGCFFLFLAADGVWDSFRALLRVVQFNLLLPQILNSRLEFSCMVAVSGFFWIVLVDRFNFRANVNILRIRA